MKTLRCLAVFLAGFAAFALSLPNGLFAQEPRLINLSTRAVAGSGANVLTVGFVISGTGSKQVLIRGVGPGIAALGFTGTLADPSLTLFNSSNVVIATNNDWSTQSNGATAATIAAAAASAGAFALPANSRDATLVVDLLPGNYTAQLSGAGVATGLALVEVYEIGSGTAKLTNLSTTGQLPTNGVMIAGLVIGPGSGTRRLLIRAAGPALTTLGVPGALADPVLTVQDSTGKITFANNDNWGTPVGSAALDAAALASIGGSFGAFAFPAGSKDASLFVDLPAGQYSVQVTATGAGGLATVEVYDLTPATPPTVTIAATKPSADESGNNNGEFTITRSGDTRAPLAVSYGVGGNAVNGYDFIALPGVVTIPAGATSVKLPVLPIPDLQTEGTDTAVVTLTPSGNYSVGAQNSATVTIADVPATLYIAALRPASGATASTSSGTATILLSNSGAIAGVSVTFSNLTSAEVTAHLTLGTNEDFVFNLPQGQVNGVLWNFTPSGLYSSAALLNALKSGSISVRIDTANYPTGEVKGAFVQGAGTQQFSAPADPPAIALTNVTATDAARFLTQTTFGPTKAEIDALTGGSLNAWIDTQIAQPFTSHRTAILADQATFGGSNSFTNWNAIHAPNRQSAWFKNALTAPDQLRQRVAFALSQLFVISDISLGDDNEAEPLAAYYDILGNGAFGSFRTLLENVTLNPMMGLYLSSLRNSKADPLTGQTPDENYAREVMQLFTIGLNQLQPDGTLALGADGLPIATYNQTTITEMAKVFTGWSYPSTNLNAFRSAARNYFSPMQNYASNHDTTLKNLSPVLVTPIPAGQSGTLDLQVALDALVNHANTGPFVARSLIQRLVTSNPSPAYVYRVAKVFADDGTSAHARGNLGAVVRAVLTDYEARSPAIAASQSFGKLKEPLLRLTQVLRAFNAQSASGRFVGFRVTVDGAPINGTTPIPATAQQIAILNGAYRLDNVQSNFAETALRSPTVFNFYHPDYVLPGALAAAGLVVPEFEITDDNYAISGPNFYRGVALANAAATAAGQYTLALNLTFEQTLVSNPAALVDYLNLVLCAGNMPAATKTRIVTALSPGGLPTATTTLERAQTAVLLTLTSPASAVQK